jgi:hypothetical protein
MMPVDAVHAGGATQEAGTSLGWAIPMTVAAAAVLGGAKLLASPLVLPVLGTASLVTGFALAAILYVSGRRHQHGAWHLAGALVFLGFAAALLSDGPEAIAQLERMQARLASAN